MGGRRSGAAVGGLGGLILLILAAVFGLNLGDGGSSLGIDAGFPPEGGQVESAGTEVVDPDADTKEFMKFLMFDIQDTWDGYFEQAGLTYQPTTLVIFDDVVSTGCGQATSAVGPFYCPAPNDQKVYVDFAFYDELTRRFGAPGDFAQAYVIAHEVGHHIQSITGISDQVRQAQAQDPGNKNEYSIRQELQADCLAGVWAYSANRRLTADTGQPIIEPGDIEEGLAAAAAVGDDRIQAQAGMTVDPHTWTHGSAEQRVSWFTRGFDTGDPEQCDPFSVSNP
jgi:predicted metalloprotease